MSKIKMLVLSLTGRCNFACRYCYAAEHNKSKMTVTTAISAVKMAAESGEKFIIQFSGGEPLLNWATMKAVIDYVAEHKINATMQLQTNGSKLTDEIAQYLFAHKVGIGISLDGRPSVNDKLRLKKNCYGATGDILKGIEVLRRNNIACGVTCVVTNENVKELAGIIEFAYFLGNVRKIGFDILRNQGRGVDLHAPSEEEMYTAMEHVYARRDALTRLTGTYITISQQERVKTLCNNCTHEFGHCYAMNGEAMFVDAQGDIYACSSLVGDKEFYIGNVKEGLAENHVERVQKIISEAMDFCCKCPDFKLCGGGCFARWYGLENKDEYGAECAMKRVSIQQVVGTGKDK